METPTTAPALTLLEFTPNRAALPAMLGELAHAHVTTPRALHELVRACIQADAATAWSIRSAHPALFDSPPQQLRQLPVAAAIAGRRESLRLMALLGFELRWEAREGGSALHHAARYGDTQTVRLLLELGAPVNMRDSVLGSSPLGWAASGSRLGRPWADEEYCIVVRMLLAAGATRADAINRWGETPESLASRRIRGLFKTLGFTPI